MTTVHICRPGVPRSAMRLNREPSEDEWKIFQQMGFERARLGPRYRHSVRCPVNGDGYWYTRRQLLCPAGTIVGTVEDPEGPRGEL